MQLQSIDVDAFGALNELTVTELDPGLSVIFGSNGSGKTTLLQFIRGILCGFREGRSVGLLPPSGGRSGGGSLRVRWDGDICRFARTEAPAGIDDLRVTLIRSDLETPHPRFSSQQLRSDLLPLLFTVSAADVHVLDSLLRQADRDGIQLVGRRENPGRLNQVAAQVHDERSALLRHNNEGLLVELAERRQLLQSELHELTDQLRQRCQRWEQVRPRRPDGDLREWQQKVTWLRNELAAAECDLREAEELSWCDPPAPRTIQVTPATPRLSLDPRQPRRREQIDVQRVYRLQQLDRRIDLARTLLAETARARLDINLRSARIAGSDDTPPEPFLQQVRDSLKSLEAGLLDLRDDVDQLSDRDSRQCHCPQWQQSGREAVRVLGKRLYQLCEQVSRYELRHRKSVFTGAEETIRATELALLQHLESLRLQRRSLLESSGNLQEWRGSTQTTVEHLHCECLEHAPRMGWKLPTLQRSAPPQPEVRTIHTILSRPTPDEMQRLRQCRDRCREELNVAVLRWRALRNWQPQFEIPAQIRELEKQIDQVRQKLDVVDSQLADGQQRWRVLSVSGEVLRRVVDKMERDQRPTVIQWAGHYLRQLTDGRHAGIDVSEDHTLEVIAADGTRYSPASLSRGALDQLSLSLRLALVRAYAARGIRFPLILDDVLVDTDQHRLRCAVELLREFAREHSQQIVYLTCQTHLTGLFEQCTVPVRTLPGSNPRRQVTETSQQEIRGWVDREPKPSVTGTSIDTQSTPAVHRGPRQSRTTRLLKPLQRRLPDGPYWLSMDASVEQVPSIGTQMGRRLTGLNLRSVSDLVDLDASERSLRLTSLQITPERLQDWQAEAQLLCCVPDLTGPDAQLLVLLGIRNVAQLSRSSVETLATAFDQLTDAQQVQIGATRRPPRDVIQRWIHNSRRARSLRNARRFSRGRGRSSSRTATRRGSGRRGASPTGRRNGPSLRRRPGARTRRPETDAREHTGPATIITPFVSSPANADKESPWRFYLSPESPVVDAPSIGPTTANRLSRIGVITVADLLNRPAADIAIRLKNRRIKEQTVLLWQRQARLMCRIPQLRGHDAQVLIACDILEPEQVAQMTPEALFEIVGPFVETVEGQRLLRSSKTPDLDEVTDWINWARHSRTLRAA